MKNSNEYRWEAKSVSGFVSQIVKLVQSGHLWYVRVLLPEGKDFATIDEKVMGLYDIKRPAWRREKRNLKGSAGIHYLRHRNVSVIMVTEGRHDKFYEDHGRARLDIRRKGLKVFGYKIRLTHSKIEGREKVFVRLDEDAERKLRAHMLTVCCWSSYRDPKRLEREFERLPWQPYGPVYEQIQLVLRAVNRKRKSAGLKPVDAGCVCKFRTLGEVFVEDSREGQGACRAA